MASTTYSVTVTDTGDSTEVGRVAQSVRVPLDAHVIACPDGGALACSDAGATTSAIQSGHYVGIVDCPPDGGVVNVPTADGGQSSGTVTLDLSVDGAAVSGSLYFLWSIGGTIAWQAGLRGAVDCSTGDLQATWENPQWGLPTTGPDGGTTVIPTGTGTGAITAAPQGGAPGTISGAFDFVPNSGGFCRGTYTAALKP
jgi:hypothetical protein